MPKTSHGPKTISKTGVRGQRGVNLIEDTVLAMGSRWTPSGPNETGIDGYIELYAPETGEALGLHLAVQSKVLGELADHREPTFDYYCDSRDVRYWLDGNAPVILIVSSPTTREAYWLSVKQYFKDWDRESPAKVVFNKSRDRFSQNSFHDLASMAAPKDGLYLPPLRRTETLHSNLLAVEFPAQIYVAATDCSTPGEVFAILRRSNADGAWVFWEKKIFSFHDLGQPPWNEICDIGTVEGFTTQDWSESTDSERRKLLVNLLNRTLRAQLSPGLQYWPKEDCFAFDVSASIVKYQSLKKSSKITVVASFPSKLADGRIFQRFRHLAFRGQFKVALGRWCLEITPTYRFTGDGMRLDRYHEEWLSGIKRLEGNRAVLSGVLLWADYLRPKDSLFSIDARPLKFGELLTFQCDAGINDARWLASDPKGIAQAEKEEGSPLLSVFESELER